MQGALLFNIFISDIFMIFEQSNICNFADVITLYSSEKKLTKINKNLIFDTKNILNWFRLNSLESKPWKILIRDSWGEV